MEERNTGGLPTLAPPRALLGRPSFLRSVERGGAFTFNFKLWTVNLPPPWPGSQTFPQPLSELYPFVFFSLRNRSSKNGHLLNTKRFNVFSLLGFSLSQRTVAFPLHRTSRSLWDAPPSRTIEVLVEGKPASSARPLVEGNLSRTSWVC